MNVSGDYRSTLAIVFVSPLTGIISINNFCRSQNPPIKFIRVDVRGACGQIFADFGPEFVVNDVNGENPHSGIIYHVSNDKQAVITVPNDEQVEFGIGEWVTFKDVEGMTELNNLPGPVKVVDTAMYNFKVDLDTTSFGKYERKSLNRYGTVIEAKLPKKLEFKSLEENIKNPDFSRDPNQFNGVFDFDKFGRPELLHLVFNALDEYQRQKGDLPATQDAAAADALVQIAKDCKAKYGFDVEIDESIVRKISRTARAILSPMASIFGGIVGQEVAKAVSNKHHPVYQYVYLDSIEMLPDYDSMLPEEVQPTGSRYDAQITVFGRSFQGKLGALNLFMVGCGALGCELFKNFAMMGVACGPNGKVTVTDDDVIEKSNLSRQFLFRNYNVGQSKSIAATTAIKEMNASIRVDANQDRVSPNTEDVYHDKFWTGLDCVVNALDNVKARQYVDARCVFFEKPLFESGTMGTKCNTQCVIPHKTINYGGRKDPETKEAPECALHNFPHNINHCLSLGRSEFIGIFDTKASEAAKYIMDPNYKNEMCSKIWGADGSELPDAQSKAKEANEILDGIIELLCDGMVKSFEDCVVWSRLKFEEYFTNKIKQLIFSCPKDMVNSSGAPFWSPPKRFPTMLEFNADDTMHMNFIIAASNLKARLYNVSDYKETRDPSFFKPILASVVVPEFQPKDGVKIETGDRSADDRDSNSNTDALQQVKNKLAKLPDLKSHPNLKVSPMEFEKDDDTNFHMDFISAFANLRARNYSIEEVDKLQARLIAGRIIPALATTTSMVTGFVCIEMIKYFQNPDKAVFKDLQANLALPMFMQIDPESAPKTVPRTIKKIPDPVNHPEYVEEEDLKTIPADGFTVWDKIVIDKGDLTVQEFVDFWKNEYGVTCTAIGVQIGDAAIAFYNQFMQGTKKNLPCK